MDADRWFAILTSVFIFLVINSMISTFPMTLNFRSHQGHLDTSVWLSDFDCRTFPYQCIIFLISIRVYFHIIFPPRVGYFSIYFVFKFPYSILFPGNTAAVRLLLLKFQVAISCNQSVGWDVNSHRARAFSASYTMYDRMYSISILLWWEKKTYL